MMYFIARTVFISLLLVAFNGMCMSKKVTKEFIPVFERMGQEQKNSLLLSASSCGDINLVANLLWHGAHVNVKNETSMTPLMAAVLNEKFEMASYLLEQDADANIAADDGKTPLLVATQKNNANLVRLLLAHRAKGNSQHIDRQKNIFGRGFDNLVIEKITPLMEAAAKGHQESVEILIARGAHVLSKDSQGWTPLRYAVFAEKLKTISILASYIFHSRLIRNEERKSEFEKAQLLLNSMRHNTDAGFLVSRDEAFYKQIHTLLSV